MLDQHMQDRRTIGRVDLRAGIRAVNRTWGAIVVRRNRRYRAKEEANDN